MVISHELDRLRRRNYECQRNVDISALIVKCDVMNDIRGTFLIAPIAAGRSVIIALKLTLFCWV